MPFGVLRATPSNFNRKPNSPANAISAGLILSIPLIATPSRSGTVPNASAARSVRFCAVLPPPMSSRGAGFGEHIGERKPGGFHLRQDKIAGAVQDAAHRTDLVSDQALAQCFDDRNAAADGGLEFQRDAVAFGECREARTVMGQQRLVGSDN